MTSFVPRGTCWLVTGLLAAVLVTVAMGDEQLEMDKKARPFLGKRHAPYTETGKDSNDASERSQSLEYNTGEEQSHAEDDLTEEQLYQTIERVSNEDHLAQFNAYNKRVRPFLGKRGADGDMQAVVSRAVRARPFLGKRPRPFLGKRTGQSRGQSEEDTMMNTEELTARLLRLHPELLHELQREEKRVRPFLG